MTAPDRDSTPWDAPLRLDVAARLFFPDGSISASSLRKEAARGRLRVYRIAGKDMTTLNDVRDETGEIRHGMRCHSRRQADAIAASSSAGLRRLYAVRVRMKRDGR